MAQIYCKKPVSLRKSVREAEEHDRNYQCIETFIVKSYPADYNCSAMPIIKPKAPPKIRLFEKRVIISAADEFWCITNPVHIRVIT